ncbi:hypothetical protein EV189_3457 [Motilibacter rhizosphaerae]|uniref:Uncharacterized protein n=1 Tax=Motilibacter rhizosphaerae TaxID=598652 RepID=A0A4Q7NAM1_9ACTN|nr:hypothetical protein [Motilibacter rhizosphaerae]RZS79978.1 hypothetical protein EV189_3457 [Motilibacter rhizosphaerae]
MSSAYRSSLTIHPPGQSPPPRASSGERTDASDPGLRRWRRVVVDPVVASLLTPEEVEAVAVRDGVHGHPDDVWVCVTACGEQYVAMLLSGEWAQTGPSDEEVAAGFADQLQDWVAESRFGWGQLREPAYDLGEP